MSAVQASMLQCNNLIIPDVPRKQTMQAVHVPHSLRLPSFKALGHTGPLKSFA